MSPGPAPAALLLCAAACGDGLGPPPLDLARMIDQPRARPFGASRWFADGRAMRPPPPGAIPRERSPLAPLVRDGLDGGRYAERIPVAVDGAELARGRARFEVLCAACHGLAGDGRSPVAAAMALRPPPSLLHRHDHAMPPGRIYRAIARGYGLMPGYGPDLTVPERWAVVAYVGALALSQSVALDSLPARLRAEAERALR